MQTMFDKGTFGEASRIKQVHFDGYHPEVKHNLTNSDSLKVFNQATMINHSRSHDYFKKQQGQTLQPRANMNFLPKNVQITFNYSNSKHNEDVKKMKLSYLSTSNTSRKRNKIFDSTYLSKQINEPLNVSQKYRQSTERKRQNGVKTWNLSEHFIQRKNSEIISSKNTINLPYNYQNKIRSPHTRLETSFINGIPFINDNRMQQSLPPHQNNIPLQKRITFNYQPNASPEMYHIKKMNSLNNQDNNQGKSPSVLQQSNIFHPAMPRQSPYFPNNAPYQHKNQHFQQFQPNSLNYDNPSKIKIKKHFSLSRLNKDENIEQNQAKRYQRSKITRFTQHRPFFQKKNEESPTMIKGQKSRGIINYAIQKDEQQSFIESMKNQRYFDDSQDHLQFGNKISFKNIQIQKAEDYSHDERGEQNMSNIFLGFQRTYSVLRHETHQNSYKTQSTQMKIHDKKYFQTQSSQKMKENPDEHSKNIQNLGLSENKISISLIFIALLLLFIQLVS